MLIIDNCKHCAAVTYTSCQKLTDLLIEIDKGEIGCWLCMEDGEHHTEFDIYEGDKKIWCGHKQKCSDVVSEESQKK